MLAASNTAYLTAFCANDASTPAERVSDSGSTFNQVTWGWLIKRAFFLGLMMALDGSALAEPNNDFQTGTATYCDDMCNPRTCTYTCCFITWDKGFPKHLNCNVSGGCCAHPHDEVPSDDNVRVPTHPLDGVEFSIKWHLFEIKSLDVAKVDIESEGNKTVTLRGTVNSELNASWLR